jgi:hypothetical protein
MELTVQCGSNTTETAMQIIITIITIVVSVKKEKEGHQRE